jgi:hypothetical protein
MLRKVCVCILLAFLGMVTPAMGSRHSINKLISVSAPRNSAPVDRKIDTEDEDDEIIIAHDGDSDDEEDSETETV